MSKNSTNKETLPSGIYVRVVHLHPGNTTKNQLKRIGKTNAKYVTIAKLYDDEHPFSVAQGIAACGSKDSPTRKLGRSIAIGRALKELNAHV